MAFAVIEENSCGERMDEIGLSGYNDSSARGFWTVASKQFQEDDCVRASWRGSVT